MSDQYLLDTHIFLWLMQGNKTVKNIPVFDTAAVLGGLRVSAITCWEVGMLAARGRIHLGKPCHDWVADALRKPGIRFLEMTPDIAVESSFLSGDFHGDPADRILVASARAHNLVLATRDEKILKYGAEGYLRTLPC